MSKLKNDVEQEVEMAVAVVSILWSEMLLLNR